MQVCNLMQRLLSYLKRNLALRLSASQDVNGTVIMASNKSRVSEKASGKLLSIRSRSSGTGSQQCLNTGLL